MRTLLSDRFAVQWGATRLRPVRPADALALFPGIYRVRNLTRWLCWEGPNDLAELEERYRSWCLGDPAEPICFFAVESLEPALDPELAAVQGSAVVPGADGARATGGPMAPGGPITPGGPMAAGEDGTAGARGQVIGEVSLRFDGHPGLADLGYWLVESHQGRGHGTALVRLALEIAFERLGAHAVTASIKGGNERSLAALDRSGFVRDRAPRGSDIEWIASLTRRRWARTPGLDRRLQG